MAGVDSPAAQGRGEKGSQLDSEWLVAVAVRQVPLKGSGEDGGLRVGSEDYET